MACSRRLSKEKGLTTCHAAVPACPNGCHVACHVLTPFVWVGSGVCEARRGAAARFLPIHLRSSVVKARRTVAGDGDSRSSRSVGMAAVVSQVDPLHPDHALGPVRHRDNPSAALADGVQPGAAKRVRRWLAAWVRYHVRQQSPVTSGAAGTPACPHCKVPNQKLCLPRVCRHGTICGTIWVTAVGILASPCAACQNRAERSCLPVQ